MEFYENEKGDLLIGSEEGVDLFKDGKISAYTPLTGVASVRDLFEDRDGDLWVATYSQGLYCLRNGQLFHHTTKEGFASDSNWSICDYRTFWFFRLSFFGGCLSWSFLSNEPRISNSD